MNELNRQRGFTLLESLVAIAIFTVGVSTAVFVITSSLSVGTRTKNKIIASTLAQEGLEVVRNIRDRNWLDGRNWTAGIDNLASACVEWDSAYDTVDTVCSQGTNLAFDGAHYTHTGNPSSFWRTVTTTYTPPDTPTPGDPEKLKVAATVGCGMSCTVSVEEYLYNWK